MRTLTLAGLSLVLLGCTPTLNQPPAQYGGISYPLLTGERLRATVVGHAFSFPKEEEGVIVPPRCQGFHADGTYFQCGDRIPIITGRYIVEHDRICATRGPYTSCWQLFGSARTGYLLRHLREGAPTHERVCIRPVRTEDKPCL